MRGILNRSGSLLSGEEEPSLLSSGSRVSEFELLSRSEAKMLPENISRREKKMRYWPAYPKYSVSQEDDNRLRKLAKASSRIMTE